ncbi:MAG: Rv3235 family protein [Actinomycetaceae bacterium]|nr:Rv3235 family protein [Actinomycetaceae bacterium]
MSTALAAAPEYEPPVRLRTIPGGQQPAKPKPLSIKKASDPVTLLNGVLPKPKPAGRHWAIIEASWDYSDQFQTEPIATEDALPDAKAWSRALALALAETLSGKRYPSRLERFLAPELYEALERRISLATRLDGPAGRSPRIEILSSRTCRVNESVTETTHTIIQGGRIRAVAIRLEARRRQWLATAIEII